MLLVGWTAGKTESCTKNVFILGWKGGKMVNLWLASLLVNHYGAAYRVSVFIVKVSCLHILFLYYMVDFLCLFAIL